MPVPHLAVGRAMKFGVQDRGLLSKRALQFQGDDLRLKVGEGSRGEFGDEGLNRMASDGTLVRQGSEFDLHLAGNVGDAARQGAGIREEDDRRAGGLVEAIRQSVGAIGWRAKHRMDGFLQLWLPRRLHGSGTGRLQLGHALLPLGA